jgi:hypothetical protein
MTVLTITSERNDHIEPLLTSAIAVRLRMLEIGLRQAQAHLAAFEQASKMSTADFIAQYAHNEIVETLDTLEWLGEYRLMQSIQDEIDSLHALRFND